MGHCRYLDSTYAKRKNTPILKYAFDAIRKFPERSLDELKERLMIFLHRQQIEKF